MHAELLAAAALGVTSVLLARPRSTPAPSRASAAVAVAPLQLVTLIKEGERHLIEVRDGFFDVKRKADPERPLLRCYTRGLAEVYFRDVEANAA